MTEDLRSTPPRVPVPQSDSSAPRARNRIMQDLGDALGRVLRLFEAERDRAARDLSLHPTDFACIGYLRRAGQVSPRDVITHLGLSSGSGTALFDRLAMHGYLRRDPNPADRRSVLLSLDSEVAAPVIQRHMELEQRYRVVTVAFSDQDLELVGDFLDQLAKVTDGDGAVAPENP